MNDSPRQPQPSAAVADVVAASPKITIVTVCLNAASTLERTLLSVQEQTYPHVEHVVIDGGSADGSVAILRRHARYIAHWASEPDRGISDGMNKGANAATGDFLVFINADDRLADPRALERAVDRIRQEPGYDFYAFCIHFGAEDGYRVRCSKPLTWRMRFKTGVLHQGVLCRRSAHHTLSGFNTSYSYALDYDYFLRAYLTGMRTLAADEVLAWMSPGGLSTQADWPSTAKRLHQERLIHIRNAPNLSWRLIYKIYWLAYVPYKRLRILLHEATHQSTNYARKPSPNRKCC
jgi:glycosyltransferase involved in cell wall biosynthesis